MTNRQIAKLLKNVAAAYSIKDEKKYKFQTIAYQKAADTIENSPSEIKDLYSDEKLEGLPGVGPSIRSHLEELIEKGSVAHFDSVLSDVPAAVFPLLDIPSFGPKKAYRLVKEFKLSHPDTVVEDLENLAKSDKIASVEGFGKKSQEDILQAIAEFKQGKSKDVRMSLPFAQELADAILTYLKKSDHVLEAFPLGSLRRQRDTIGDIDFAVITDDDQAVLDYFTRYPYTQRVIQKGENDASILVSGGTRVDLRTQPKKSFGSLLQHFTGGKNHNIHLREIAQKKGLSLSEYGIKNETTGKITEYDTEEKFYHALGLDWMEPELREDRGEISAALKHVLPRLVELKDIKGDFHLHSSFPIEPSHDLGHNTMEEMLKEAEKLGYDYMGFSEHNPSVSKHTPQESYELILKRSKEIDRQKSKYSIRIFSLLETDILASGELGIDNDSLSLLDGTIVSIHSVFSMDKKQMTERVLKGLSHPKAKILAHPTGRLINQRTGYDLDWDRIFEFCVKNNKALEINASPYRLDLPDQLIKPAVEAGVKFFIDTDSHSINEMTLMKYGVSVARRGWATKGDILNTWEYNKLAEWFKK